MKGILGGIIVFIVLIWMLSEMIEKQTIKMHEEKEILLNEKY